MKINSCNALALVGLLSFSGQTLSVENSEIEEIKTQLKVLQAKLEKLERERAEEKKKAALLAQQQVKNVVGNPQEGSSQNSAQAQSKGEIKLYSTLRPTFGYIDENGENELDVRDALSHAGFKSTTEFADGWSAILHGEWGIDLSDNGDFGKARQVYVAVDSPYGRIGIGKQRPVQYLFIAEYVDVFNHSNSPFAYDPESLFFVNNLITYQKKIDDFTLMAVAQFNGDSGDDYQDLINTGVSYDRDNLHLALTYTKQDAYSGQVELGQDRIWGMSAAYEFNSGFYAALGYQDKTYQREDLYDRNGHTFDLSLAYPLSEYFKIKSGYFNFKDGKLADHSFDYDGVNLTLEWLPAQNLRFHLEYLNRDFDYREDFSSVSVGFRYDYAQTWQY